MNGEEGRKSLEGEGGRVGWEQDDMQHTGKFISFQSTQIPNHLETDPPDRTTPPFFFVLYLSMTGIERCVRRPGRIGCLHHRRRIPILLMAVAQRAKAGCSEPGGGVVPYG